jgi:hypothetical protein
LAAICLKYALAELNGPMAILQCGLYGGSGPYGVVGPPPWLLLHSPFIFAPVMWVSDWCTHWRAVPLWLHALWVVAAGLYIVASLRLVQNRGSAFPIFACALFFAAMGFIIHQYIPVLPFGGLSWHWKSFYLRERLPLTVVYGILWPLIVCMVIGLVVHKDNKRKTSS